MRKLEEPKGASLGIIASAECWGIIPGVQDLGYEPNVELTAHRTGFGGDGVVCLTSAVGAVQGGFDVEGVENENLVQRYVMRQAEADFVGFDIKQARAFFIYSNVTDEDGKHIAAHFIRLARLAKAPAQVAPAAKRFEFQAAGGVRYIKAIYVEEFEGAAQPVTVLTLENTAIKSETGSYVLVVIRNNTVLTEGTDFTATATAVTLSEGQGLGADDKAVVAYLYDPETA